MIKTSGKKHAMSTGKDFTVFVNPPEVRFAQHIFGMCASFRKNYEACCAAWHEISESATEDRKQKALEKCGTRLSNS